VTFMPQDLEDPLFILINIFIEQYEVQKLLSQQQARIAELEARLAEQESEEDNNLMQIDFM